MQVPWYVRVKLLPLRQFGDNVNLRFSGISALTRERSKTRPRENDLHPRGQLWPGCHRTTALSERGQAQGPGEAGRRRTWGEQSVQDTQAQS